MGRSVAYFADDNAEVEFFTFGEGDSEEIYTEFHWRDDRDCLIDNLTSKFKSLYEPYTEEWSGNEIKIILKNGLVEIGLSEYCGLSSLSIRPREWDWYSGDKTGLAVRWIAQNWETICSYLPNRYSKVGTFSNGECLYEKR